MKRSKISFLLTKAEMELFKSVLYLEPCLVDGIEKAKVEDNQYRVKFFIDDIEESLSALSFAADYAKSLREKEKLYSLHCKIKGYMSLSKELRQSITNEEEV